MLLLRKSSSSILRGVASRYTCAIVFPAQTSTYQYYNSCRRYLSEPNKCKEDNLGLSEIYRGKKRALRFDTNSKKLSAHRTKEEIISSLTVDEIKNTLKLKLTDIFLPRNYPYSVKGNYLKYCTFAALGMGLSAAGGVLSTQSMLFAVGMGAGAVPMAAALNWVLKDGLGQLGGMAFTALVNSRLDADSRGWRILSACLLEVSTWLEVLTPLFPHYFLLLATLANVGKNISWLAGSATRAGIRYGFVNAHNMGDITAKEGSQTVAITVFGTFIGILLSNLIGPGHMQYVLMSSLCISSISLFCIYRSLHCVCLPTLNYQRGEIVTHHYLATGEILTPDAVSKMERFYLPYLKVKSNNNEKRIPVVVGAPLQTTLSTATNYNEIDTLMEVFKNEKYILSYCPYVNDKQGIFRSLVNHERRRRNIVGVTLKEDASPSDQIRGYYHAHLLREIINKLNKEKLCFSEQVDLIKQTQTRLFFNSVLYLELNSTFDSFKSALEKGGWNCTDLFFEEINRRFCN